MYPYLLWIGAALTLVGCAFGIIGLIGDHSSDEATVHLHP